MLEDDSTYFWCCGTASIVGDGEAVAVAVAAAYTPYTPYTHYTHYTDYIQL